MAELVPAVAAAELAPAAVAAGSEPGQSEVAVGRGTVAAGDSKFAHNICRWSFEEAGAVSERIPGAQDSAVREFAVAAPTETAVAGSMAAADEAPSGTEVAAPLKPQSRHPWWPQSRHPLEPKSRHPLRRHITQ